MNKLLGLLVIVGSLLLGEPGRGAGLLALAAAGAHAGQPLRSAAEPDYPPLSLQDAAGRAAAHTGADRHPAAVAAARGPRSGGGPFAGRGRSDCGARAAPRRGRRTQVGC